MSTKGHVTLNHISMYLEEKLKKRKLEDLKDRFKKELKAEQADLENYKRNFETYVYEAEYESYLEKNEKNLEILAGLKMIFPEDSELKKLEI